VKHEQGERIVKRRCYAPFVYLRFWIKVVIGCGSPDKKFIHITSKKTNIATANTITQIKAFNFIASVNLFTSNIIPNIPGPTTKNQSNEHKTIIP